MGGFIPQNPPCLRHCLILPVLFNYLITNFNPLLLLLPVHSFILFYFYSASLSPLLLRGAFDTAYMLCRSFTPKAPQATPSEGFAQSPYVAARAGLEPATIGTKGVESTNEPPRPTPRPTVGITL